MVQDIHKSKYTKIVNAIYNTKILKMAKKKKVITINGMVKKFGVTRMTIYNKYIPSLKAIPSTLNKKIFDYDEVMKLHASFSKEEKKYEIVD